MNRFTIVQNNKPRILFLHAMPTAYRLPLFQCLARTWNIHFFFTQGDRWRDDTHISQSVPYTNFHEIHLPGYTSDVAPGIIPQLLFGKYDVVIASVLASFPTHVSFVISKMIRRKKYITFDEQWSWPTNIAGRILLPYARWIARSADYNIVAGTQAKKFFVETLGVRPEKVIIAYNTAEDLRSTPIDDQKLQLLRQELNPDNAVTFLYFGRVVEVKNLDALIRAFTPLEKSGQKVRLIVCGDGAYMEYCKRMSAELQLTRIYFAGSIEHAEAVYYYHLADVVVLPGRFLQRGNLVSEAWGMTLNEALSLGKPLISSTAVGGSFDLIIDGKNGSQVPADDSVALQTALESMMDGNYRKQAAARSRQLFEEKFSGSQQQRAFSHTLSAALLQRDR